MGGITLDRTSPNKLKATFIERIDEFSQAAALDFHELLAKAEFQLLIFSVSATRPPGKAAVGKSVCLMLAVLRWQFDAKHGQRLCVGDNHSPQSRPWIVQGRLTIG